jgi:subtilisin family serine protease
VATPITQFAVDSASQLYLGFFGRAPDTAGLYYWSSQIAQGTTPLEVAKGFALTAEFSQKYNHLDPAGQVNLAYQNILSRAPDAGGAEYWTGKLKSDTTIGEIIWSLVNSAFTQQDSSDALLVQSKVFAAQSLMVPTILDKPISAWNTSSGYGVINVAAAAASILGIAIEQGASFKTSVDQWPIPVSHFQDVWAAGYTGKGVVVAVIDTGLDLSNNALNHDISPWSWNFVSNNANVQDDNGHGTAVASQIVARPTPLSTPASKSIYGGAYDAQLMVLKTLDAQGNGTQANLVNAINYAVEHGAQVINLSVGGSFNDAQTLAALNNAATHGVIVCMAAGNTGAVAPQYPAQYAKAINTTIAVGSAAQNADGSLVLAASTNGAGSYTPYNYIAAPGSKVLAYGLNGVLQNWSGTSFATPYVTAAVADLLSANTGLSADLIVNALVNTSVSLVGNQTPILA